MSANTDGVAAETRSPIFLSYARADRPRAVQVAAALTAAGYDVWWDVLIDAGTAFAKSIEAALERAEAVVVLWSKTAAASDWVRDEAGRGRDRQRLVPLLLDGELPPLGFRQYHAVDLSKWRGDAGADTIQQVVRAIEGVRGQAVAVPTPQLAAPRSSRRALMIGAGAFAVAGSSFYAWQRGLVGGDAIGNSIAVLPFKNLSGDPAQAYFSDGLSEELRATLARDARLKVMAQTSANQFRDRTEDITRIASKLGVAFLLGGSVRRSADVVRIGAELIDGKNGFSRWSQSFDRQINDVFAIQSEIAGVVANALSASILGGKKLPIKALGGTTNVAAYDAYLKGRAFYNLNSGEDSSRQSLLHLKAAVAADPNFAMAHAIQAFALTSYASGFAPAEELRHYTQNAIASAQRAVALAPELAEAHSALANSLLYSKLDVRAPQEAFERSRALGNGEAAVMARYAEFASIIGRHADARATIARAVDLDPLNALIRRLPGFVRLSARDFAGARPYYEQALKLNPKLRSVHAKIGDSYLGQEQWSEARAHYQLEPSDMMRLPGIAIAEHKRGNQKAADLAMVGLIEKFSDSALYQQAQVRAQWGDKAAALSALEKAFAVGDAGMLDANNDFLLDPVRSEPRMIKLLKAMGFESIAAADSGKGPSVVSVSSNVQ